MTKKDGWWSYAVGSGKSIDTDKYFVICANVIGGCMGSFGPGHENPKTMKIPRQKKFMEQIFQSSQLMTW